MSKDKVRKSDEKIKWINRGGPFYMPDPTEDDPNHMRRIEHKKRFLASPSQIPKAFRDTIRPVEPLVDDEMEGEEVDQPYKIVKHKKVEGMYNVIDVETKKPVNDEPLSKKDARKVVKQLS